MLYTYWTPLPFMYNHRKVYEHIHTCAHQAYYSCSPARSSIPSCRKLSRRRIEFNALWRLDDHKSNRRKCDRPILHAAIHNNYPSVAMDSLYTSWTAAMTNYFFYRPTASHSSFVFLLAACYTTSRFSRLMSVDTSHRFQYVDYMCGTLWGILRVCIRMDIHN